MQDIFEIRLTTAITIAVLKCVYVQLSKSITLKGHYQIHILATLFCTHWSHPSTNYSQQKQMTCPSGQDYPFPVSFYLTTVEYTQCVLRCLWYNLISCTIPGGVDVRCQAQEKHASLCWMVSWIIFGGFLHNCNDIYYRNSNWLTTVVQY